MREVALSVKSRNFLLSGAAEPIKRKSDQVVESDLHLVSDSSYGSLRNSNANKAGPCAGFTVPATSSCTDWKLQNLVLSFKFFTGLQRTFPSPL